MAPLLDLHDDPPPTAADARWMARALQLAAKGLYTTGVNPRVGCVLVKDGQLIGEGWHERAGEAHAEIWALRDAARRGYLLGGHLPHGTTAYVTLEPCAHYGKTPPCAEALIAAGVSRVVAALADPNPLVAGRGFGLLRAAGISVSTPLMADAAAALNMGFIKRMQHGKPWLRLKMAGSLDGRSALANGQSQWLTGPAARQDGHHYRARAQALITGIGTVLADDPQFTVRDVAAPLAQAGEAGAPSPLASDLSKSGRLFSYDQKAADEEMLSAKTSNRAVHSPFALSLSKGSGLCNPANAADMERTPQTVPLATPWRVVVDSRLRTPLNAKILGPGCLIATATDNAAQIAPLETTGSQVVQLPDAAGRVDLAALLDYLAAFGVNEAHLEAGAGLSGAFVAAGLVDEYLFYLAPCLLGGDAHGFLAALGLTTLAQKPALKFVDVRMIGDDLRIMARPGR